MNKDVIVGLAIILFVATGIVYNIFTGGIINFLLFAGLAVCLLVSQAFSPDPYGDDEGGI